MSTHERNRPNVSFSDFKSKLEGLSVQHLDSENHLQELYDLAPDLSELTKLFSFRNPFNGNECFFIFYVTAFLKRGYTCQDLISIAEIKDLEGNRLLQDSNDLRPLLYKTDDPKDTVRKILAFAKIKDGYGQTFFRRDESKPGAEFDGMETIIHCIKVGLLPHQVNELMKIVYSHRIPVTSISSGIRKFLGDQEIIGIDHGDEKIPVFTIPRDTLRFLENGGTREYALGLLEFQKEDTDECIFDQFTIGLLKETGCSIEQVGELLSLTANEGHKVFSKGIDVDTFFREINDVQTAQEFVKLMGPDHISIFRDGQDINDFVRSGGTLEEAKAFASIVNDRGNPQFKGFEIAFLKKMGVTTEFAKRMATKGLNGNTTVLFYLLGLDFNDLDYKDNGKPKALILITTSDAEQLGFSHPFYSPEAMKILEEVLPSYDFKIRAISRVNELFNERGDVDLLWIGGHGEKDQLVLGEDKPKYGVSLGRSAKITLNTSGFEDFLSQLHKNAVVYLDACSCAEGGKKAKNLANHLAAKLPPSTTLIATSGVKNPTATALLSANPFQVKTFSNYGRTEDTYVVKR